MSQYLSEGTPWGLPADLLQPWRRVQDPLSRLVFTRLEALLIEWPAIHRLGRVQLNSGADAAYPNDTAPRLAHSQGTVGTVDRMMSTLNPLNEWGTASPSLFEEWGDQRGRHWGQAVVLGRLAALLHDLLHVPYSHWLEDVYGFLDRHDAAVGRFDLMWATLPDYFDGLRARGRITDLDRTGLQTMVDGPLAMALRGAILTRIDTGVEHWYPWLVDLVHRFPGADVADYLRRDNLNAGRPFAFDDRWMDAVTVIPRSHAEYPSRLAFAIRRRDRVRTEVVDSILRTAGDRHDAFRYLYRHRRVLQRVAMLAKAVEGWLLHRIEVQQDRPRGVLDVEKVLLTVGDEGLVLHLRDLWEREGDLCASSDARQRLANVSTIAAEIMSGPSEYWVPVAECDDLSAAYSLASRFAAQENRSALEARIGDDTGAASGDLVLIIPPPQMKAKRSSQILLMDGRQVIPASESRWAPDFEQIRMNHEATWSAQLFVRPAVAALFPQLVEALITHTQAQWRRAETVGRIWP